MFTVSNGQVLYNGKPVEQMSEEERSRAYGTAGNIGTGAQTFDFSSGTPYDGNLDPRYWESYTINRGDADPATGYTLRPEYQRMRGMAQLGVPRSVGGAGEAIDPSGITYDEEFGYITPITNVQAPRSTWLQQALPYIMAAGGLGAIGMTGGFSGLLGAGSGAAGAGSLGTVTGLEPITLGALEGGVPALETLGASGFPAGAGIAGPVLETAGAATNVPWSTQVMANAAANPLMAARAAMGLTNIVGGISNRGGSGPSADGLLNTNAANVPAFNPMGLLSGYKPMQFDPVPFMSGRYGG
jgi:hypothetical protein